MIVREVSGTKFYQFSSLNKYSCIFHGFFTRHGGFSTPPYESLNVAYKVGDDVEIVDQNIKKIEQVSKPRQTVAVNQDHGCKIIIIDNNYLKTYQKENPPTADAIITSETGVALVIKVADCQAIFLFDPVKKVVANVHCGWRGNVNGIIARTVAAMKDVFNSNPSDIIATVSPSLGPCCCEFKDHNTLLPPSFQRFKAKGNHFDFWKISRTQLLESGILQKHIEIAEICTVCNSRDFFSYRKEKITGRCAALIMLKETSEA